MSEASEKATYDTVVAIGPVQVMGFPAFLEGNHWLMGKLRSKILTENKGYYIGKCYLEKGKQMLFYFGEVFIFKILQVLKKGLASYPWVHCARGVTKFYCCL